jgi:hypothetical protein
VDISKIVIDTAVELQKKLPQYRLRSETSSGSLVGDIIIGPADKEASDLIKNERGITLYYDRSKKRILAECMKPSSKDGESFPRSYDRLEWIPNTSFAPTRTPLAIATGLWSKMFPIYLTKFDEAVKLREQYERQERDERRLLKEFGSLVNGDVDYENHRVSHQGVKYRDGGYIQELTVGAGVVEINLRMIPVDVARSMLEVWMKNERPGRDDSPG